MSRKEYSTSERLSSGIANFDAITEGGFKKSSINMLAGISGSGKTIFAMHFIMDGIARGEKCLYVAFDEKKSRFYKDMRDLGLNLEEYEKQGLFTFLEYTPAKIRSMLDEGGGAVENIIFEKKISRLVIDSITSFSLIFESRLEKREASLSLFDMIQGWNCTTLITLEADPLKKDESIKNMDFEADSIIFFYSVRESKERKRYLEIIKMRGTKHSKEIFEFEIGESGIEMSSSPSGIQFK